MVLDIENKKVVDAEFILIEWLILGCLTSLIKWNRDVLILITHIEDCIDEDELSYYGIALRISTMICERVIMSM